MKLQSIQHHFNLSLVHHYIECIHYSHYLALIMLILQIVENLWV
ncbi:unnamed protein product [Brugia pahangi]|uniref:Uncharacterized protein n=1 Tax=Brugia pahangi TaxID=6280 RepID=A0A0N4TI19_BRUPA|nr:unnamed protein product [Brugia pahangi]